MTQQHIKLQQEVLTRAYHNYRRQLRRYAAAKTSNAQLVDDLMQETFLKAWKFLSSGGRVTNMKPFLYQILHNLIIDSYRRNHTKILSLDALVEKGFEPDHTGGGFEHISDLIEGKKLMLLIQKLPNLYRDPLNMRYIEHLTIEEISRRIGQTKNAVAVQIHRGLLKLTMLANCKLAKNA